MRRCPRSPGMTQCKHTDAPSVPLTRRQRRRQEREDARLRALTSDLATEFITPFSSQRAAYDDRPCTACTRNMYMNIVQTVMGVGERERREYVCEVHGGDGGAAGGGMHYMRQTQMSAVGGSGAGAAMGHASHGLGGEPLWRTSGPEGSQAGRQGFAPGPGGRAGGYAQPRVAAQTEEGEIDLQHNFQTRLHAVQAELAHLASINPRGGVEAHPAAQSPSLPYTQTDPTPISLSAARSREAALTVEAMWLNLSLASLEESRRTARTPAERARVGRVRMEGMTPVMRERVGEAMASVGLGMMSGGVEGGGMGAGLGVGRDGARPGASTRTSRSATWSGHTVPAATATYPQQAPSNPNTPPFPVTTAPTEPRPTTSPTTYPFPCPVFAHARDPEAGLADPPPAYMSVAGSEIGHGLDASAVALLDVLARANAEANPNANADAVASAIGAAGPPVIGMDGGRTAEA